MRLYDELSHFSQSRTVKRYQAMKFIKLIKIIHKPVVLNIKKKTTTKNPVVFKDKTTLSDKIFNNTTSPVKNTLTIH